MNFSPPGTHSSCPGPVTVNGAAWSPWNSIFTLPNTTTGCSLAANVLQCSYICNIMQAPSAANNWEAIYDFDDNAPSGPHMFTIQLQYFCPSVDAGPDQAVCNGSGALLNASGGMSYSWSPATGLSCTTCPNPTAAPLTTTTYTVTATDVNGCSASDAVTVTVSAIPAISFTVADACFGNAVNVVNTTTANITSWNWDFGDMQTSNLQNPLPVTYSTEGAYTITLQATDNMGCTGSAQQSVNVFANPSATATAADAGCATATNGAIDISVQGDAPFQFNWSNGNITEDLQNIQQGNYDVTFTDVHGCSGTASASVGLAPALGISMNSSDFNGFGVSCNGSNNGSIDLIITNGVLPNTFSWSTGTVSEDISQLSAGNYSVTVTDDAGCTIGGNVALDEPSALSVTVTGVAPACFGGNDGTANAVAGGGVPVYSYEWSDGSAGGALAAIPAGDYTVTVTDMNGCTAESMFTLPQPSEVIVSVQSDADTIPFFGLSAQLSATVQNASGTGTFSWHPAASLNCADCRNPQASPVATTTYVLVCTDDNGCSGRASITIYVNRDKVFYVPNAFTPNDDGINDVFRIYSEGVQQADVFIFDRWGEKIYEWSGMDGGWDGRTRGSRAEPGAYVYFVKLRWLDGQEKSEKGSITVIR